MSGRGFPLTRQELVRPYQGMSAWEAATRVLEASNKFLFGGALVGLVAWLFRDQFGFDPRITYGIVLVGLLCGGALIWEAVAKLVELVMAWRKAKRHALAVEAQAKKAADAAIATRDARRHTVIMRIQRLSDHALATLDYMVRNEQQELTEATDNPVLKEIVGAELMRREPTRPNPDRAHYRIPDFVWAWLNEDPVFLREAGEKVDENPPWAIIDP